MKVIMKQLYASTDRVIQPDEEADFPKAEAEALIKSGAAVAVGSDPSKEDAGNKRGTKRNQQEPPDATVLEFPRQRLVDAGATEDALTALEAAWAEASDEEKQEYLNEVDSPPDGHDLVDVVRQINERVAEEVEKVQGESTTGTTAPDNTSNGVTASGTSTSTGNESQTPEPKKRRRNKSTAKKTTAKKTPARRSK